jgi:hypothetical protein
LLPSGDTVAGGDFNFRFNILPGDVDQNGVITGLDGSDVRQHFLQLTTTSGYNSLYDTSGKGEITGIDLNAVQATLLTSLPATDPTPPGQGGGGELASAADSSATPAALAAPSIAAPPAAPAATPAAVSMTATAANARAAATMTSTAIVASVSPSFASAPVTPPAKALARDLVLETLPDSTSDNSADRLLAAVSNSVTSLNSLALSGNASRHGGWMLAHDAIFAKLDSASLISASSNRTSKTKRGG